MNENIFDKRRLKTFSNCKDLVRSMVGTRDGVIVYNEKFRLDLENTCYKASICEDLQKENQELKGRIDNAVEIIEKEIEDLKDKKRMIMQILTPENGYLKTDVEYEIKRLERYLEKLKGDKE